LNGVLAVEIDGLRSIWALRENADAAADADDGCRRLHRDRALMAELAADILQRALRQFGQHVAAIGSGIVDELVDHQTGIRRNTQGAFVEKQKLYGAGRRGVNAFLVQHARADGERGGRAAGRCGLATGIDRGRGADLLRRAAASAVASVNAMDLYFAAIAALKIGSMVRR